MSSLKDNEKSQNQFLTRVGQIPLVKALCQTVASTYEHTKSSNALISVTLDKVEGIAKVANDQAEPLKKLLDRPLTVVSRIADQQLEELQRRFPAINSTPHDIIEYGHNLYERSGVKSRLEDISVAKSRSVDKITGTSIYYRNRLVGSAHNGQVVINRYISGALDYTEGLVDKYVASPDSKKRPDEPETHTGYPERIRRLSGKVVGGVTYRTATSYNAAKRYTAQTYVAADKLVKAKADAVTSFVQGTINDLGRIRESVLNEIATRSRAITAKSDSAAVFVTKTVSSGVATVSDRVISTATPLLPEGLEKPAASLVSYAYHWQERVERASTVGDILSAAADETKKNVRLAQELIRSILNNSDAHVTDNKRW